MNIEEKVLKELEELKKENIVLKEKINKLENRKRRKRKPIKTTKQEIIEYWEVIQDESGLSIDWAEAGQRRWRCGYEKRLQRCHIIPDSLGGKDEPANLVLLCERCHIDAPNVESKTFMWDWIRANGTTFYDTFWNLRAEKEYEFIYHKQFAEELIERNIITNEAIKEFCLLPIGRSVNHFAHPWKNDSTNAGLLRMRLEAYDKKYKNRKKNKNNNFVQNPLERLIGFDAEKNSL